MTITQSSTRFVTVAVGIALAFSLIVGAFVATTPARAASLTAAQVQAIVSLLQSFGADAATIANVQASLLGQATPGTGSTGGACPVLTRDLQLGSSGADVKSLQVFLNSSAATQVAAAGAGSPGLESTYFGGLTKAAAMKFQAANNVSPIAGYVGAITRAAIAAVCGKVNPPGTPGTPGVPVSGNGLKVVLSPDSPNNVSLVAGQAAGLLAKFTFVNPTNAAITVTNLSFKRIGVSNDTTMTNVYLYNGAVRLTDSTGVTNSAFNFNNPSGLFTVAAGGTYTVSVASDIALLTGGQQLGVQLVSVGASGTLDTGTSFPINSFTQTISTATLAGVDFATAAPTPAVNTSVDPQADYTVWQTTVTINTRAVWLKAFALREIGSIQAGDVVNFRLYVDGTMVGTAVHNMDANSMITFDLSANPVNLNTGGRVIKVIADVVGGASRTFSLSLRYPADAIFVDSNLGQPVLPTVNSLAFSSRTTGVQTINSASATNVPSVTRAADSPTSNVSVGATNVKWASFKLLASGEDVKIDNLNILAVTSGGFGLQNGAIFINGVQVGSTKNLTNNTDVNFTFGSSLILKAGTVTTLDIFADAKGTAGVNLLTGTTATTSIDAGSTGNAQGQISLNSITLPASIVTGNTITIASSALTATKASGYGNQTMIAGSQNAKIGSFTLSAGSTEGINVNTIEIGFASAVSATMTNLTLRAHNTGTVSDTQVGSPRSSIGLTNSFSVNEAIPASGTKTYDVYANLQTAANVGAIPAMTVTTNTTGTGATTGTSVSVLTAGVPTLQTITVGSGLLTAANDTGNTPDSANVVAGSSVPVKVGSFRFTAQYSPFTVDKIAVKIPSGAATSVSSVILKYKDAAGLDQSSTQVLTTDTTSPYATSTFSGLTFYVPQNDSRDLDVYVSIPTIASGASTGAAISALLSYNTGFNATDSAGNASTSIGTVDLTSVSTGKGTMYVRKSIPVLSSVALDSTSFTSGSNVAIGRAKVTADSAGDVGWKKIVFAISKSAQVSLGATTTITLWDGGTQVGGTFATTSATVGLGTMEAFSSEATTGATSGNLVFIATNEQQITAGSSRTYELRAGTLATGGTGSQFVSVTVPQTATTSITAAYATIEPAAPLGDVNESFVWTDRSSISTIHSQTTLDWTSDYLVKTLPLSIGTRTGSF